MPDTAATLMPPVAAPLPAITLTPQDRARRPGGKTILSLVLSLAVIAAVLHELRNLEWRAVLAMIPASPLFWLAFAASYLVNPAADWLIFRKLWAIPAGGFGALVRKKIYNELLLGYLGEAYFYAWARRRVGLAAAPFGAVKDVAILSAMTGNAVTIVLVAVMFPLLGARQLGLDGAMLTWSLALILAISAAAMVLRRRVFSLERRELGLICRIHLTRIVTSNLLNAVLWHLALPGVALGWWLYMATLRQLVSRLPLVPNKDLLFAGIAVLGLGHEHDIGTLMALMAGLILTTHLVLGTALALHDLIWPETKP